MSTVENSDGCNDVFDVNMYIWNNNNTSKVILHLIADTFGHSVIDENLAVDTLKHETSSK